MHGRSVLSFVMTSERRQGRAQGYAAIAAISGLIPTIFITRVKL
jgi:hypothetical protein